jgi:outer membrane protein assembly factor BamB
VPTAAVTENNGVFLTPNEEMLIVINSAAVVLALDPDDGTEIWRYNPTSMATSISSMGGVAFAGSEYMVYSVLDDNTRYVRTTRPCP